jgi:hypothetical protein
MTEAHDPIAYAEQVSFLRDSVKALADEALDVFAEDFPQFFHREARRRFLAAPAFARDLSDDALKRLKTDLETEGRAASERLLARLRALEPWLAGTEVAEPAGKSLEDNPKLWAVVASIADDVERLLAKHGLPADPGGGYGVVYHEPKRFVSGHYMPTIAETYWRRIAELREIEQKVSELEHERERAELLSRWNRF